MSTSLAFWDATFQGDLTRMREYITEEPGIIDRHPPTWKSVYQPTAIAYAIWGNQPSAVRLLLEMGANPNLADGVRFAGEPSTLAPPRLSLRAMAPHAQDNNYHPLHWASYKGDQAECAQLLVDAGADVNVTSARGFTPLQMAHGLNDVVSAKPGVAAVLEEALRNPRVPWAPSQTATAAAPAAQPPATASPQLPVPSQPASGLLPPLPPPLAPARPTATAWSPLEAAAVAATAAAAERDAAAGAFPGGAEAAASSATPGGAPGSTRPILRPAVRASLSADSLPNPTHPAARAASPPEPLASAWHGSVQATAAVQEAVASPAKAMVAGGPVKAAAAPPLPWRTLVASAAVGCAVSTILHSCWLALSLVLAHTLAVLAWQQDLPIVRRCRQAVVIGANAWSEAGTSRPALLPPQFLCPITGDVMRDPVTTADGHAFERTAIERWLLTNSTSPMTGAPLSHKQLAPAIALRQLIAMQAPRSIGSPSPTRRRSP